MLELFLWILLEYELGAESFQDVARELEQRSVNRDLPEHLPCSLQAVSRAALDAESFFGHFYGLGADAPLFIRTGRHKSVVGFTVFAILARQDVPALLRDLSRIEETD
jgi:hypothetical protein